MYGQVVRKQLPKYYAIFIIAALFPQIAGFNGSLLDTVWKMMIVSIFLLFAGINFMKMTKYGFVYICIYFIGELFVFLINEESFINIMTNIVLTSLLIILFMEFPNRVTYITIDSIIVFYKIYTCFIFISCIYNMLIHTDAILHLTSVNMYGTEYISSFFDNKNTFGVFLIFGCLAATILRYYTRKFRWIVIIAVFILNELMAMCRTAIVLSLVLLAISFLISENGITLKRFLVVSIVVLLIVEAIVKIEVFNEYFFGKLFSSTDSLDTRQSYIDSMRGLLNGIHLIFGYGSVESRNLAVLYTGNRYYHNSYLSVLMSNGVIGLVLFISAIGYSIIKVIKIFRIDRATGGLCGLSCVVYVIYAYVESAILFTTPVIAMVSTIFVVAMPTLFYKALILKKG